MFEARFVMSKIRSIQWIGKSHIEVLVEQEYAKGFERRVAEIGVLSMADKFDPSAHHKDPSEEQIQTIQRNFARRMARNILRCPQEKVRTFYEKSVEQAGENIIRLVEQEITRLANETNDSNQAQVEVNDQPTKTLTDVSTNGPSTEGQEAFNTSHEDINMSEPFAVDNSCIDDSIINEPIMESRNHENGQITNQSNQDVTTNNV